MTNALVVHGGAPTAVINASLYGAVEEARASGRIDHLYASLGGTSGILKKRFLDLFTVPQEELDLLPDTPASAIGTSRDVLEQEDYRQIARILQEYEIRYIFCNGGNGTMDACGKIYKACCEAGFSISVVGIPKTIDNDLPVTDHAPGFASAIQRQVPGGAGKAGPPGTEPQVRRHLDHPGFRVQDHQPLRYAQASHPGLQ